MPAQQRDDVPIELNAHRLLPAHTFVVGDEHFLVDVLRARSFGVPAALGPELHAAAQGAWQPEGLSTEGLAWLYRRELLVPRDAPLPAPFADEAVETPAPWALYLILTERCNLRCRYCVVDDVYAGGRAEMSDDVIAASIEEFLGTTPLSQVEIHLFGGEPLVRPRAVRFATTHAEAAARRLGKEVRFVLYTNGVLLDERWLDFLAEHDYTVLLSFDGPAEVQNYARAFPDGRGTFEVVRRNAQRLATRYGAEGREFAARAIVTGAHPEVKPTVELFRELGFGSVSLSPVFAASEEAFSLRGRALRIFLAELEELANRHVAGELQGKPFRLMSLPLYMRKVNAHRPQRFFCWAGGRSLAVSPTGTYYPCFNWAGLNEDQYALGGVQTGLDAEKRRAYLEEVAVERRKGCAECWARYLCGGGCNACSSLACACAGADSSRDEQCAYFRRHLELAVYASERLRKGDPTGWPRRAGASLACVIDRSL